MVSPYENLGAPANGTENQFRHSGRIEVADARSSNVLEIPQTPEAQRKAEQANIEQAGRLLSWANNNLGRFDLNGDKKINLGEIDLGLRTSSNPVDRQMLGYLSDHFYDFKRNPNDGISVKDLQKNLQRQSDIAQQNEIARQQLAARQGQEAGSRDFMSPLLRTADGDPNGSLFRVLDTIRNHRPDDEISKRDLERYLSEYDRRTRTGDTNSGQFTPENRQYVQNLRDNWDSPEVRRLRGTWLDSNNEEHANGSITAKSLRAAGGLGDDIFGSFISTDAPAKKVAAPVTADMVNNLIPHSNEDRFNNTPRTQDDAARAADSQRVTGARDLFSWAQNNLGRYDIDGDKALNLGEVDLGVRTTKDETSSRMLKQMEDGFPQLSHHGKISNRDLEHNWRNQQSIADSNETWRQQRAGQEHDQAASRDLMSPLFSTPDGHPNNSLFKVLDGERGHPHDRIGKKELKHYLDEYDWRSRNGDVGSGHYRPQDRAYVQFLYDNWDTPDVVRLRGTYSVRDNHDRDHVRQIANSTITIDSLKSAGGYGDVYDLYLSNKQGS